MLHESIKRGQKNGKKVSQMIWMTLSKKGIEGGTLLRHVTPKAGLNI